VTDHNHHHASSDENGGYMWVVVSLVFGAVVIVGALLWVRHNAPSPTPVPAQRATVPPAALSATPVPSAAMATPTAVMVETSDRAEALQRELKALGYYAGALDAVFGPSTQDALRRLQAHLGVPATGDFDAKTWRAAAAKGDLSPSQTVMTIQLALKNLSEYQGVIDGQFGSETEAAIRRYEKAHGLPQDGAWSPTLDTAVEQSLDGND